MSDVCHDYTDEPTSCPTTTHLSPTYGNTRLLWTELTHERTKFCRSKLSVASQTNHFESMFKNSCASYDEMVHKCQIGSFWSDDILHGKGQPDIIMFCFSSFLVLIQQSD